MDSKYITVTNCVTKSITKDYLNQISTKGYDFYWDVANSGYEWCDRKKYYAFDENYKEKFGRSTYNKDMILFNPYEDRMPPARIDFGRPWLVKKGKRDLWLEYKQTPPPKNWFKFQIPEHEYKPLTIRSLHRRFASLKTENLETSVLAFANKYGWLGRDVSLGTFPLPSGIVDYGESLYRWRKEIEKMGVSLAIWDLIRNKDNKLGQIILWSDSSHVSIRLKWRCQKGHYEISKWDGQKKDAEFGHIHEGVETHTLQPDFFKEYKRGEFIGPAWYYLGLKINHHLVGIRPKLTGYREPEVTYVPGTLLDAMWLLFMQEVNGKIKTERCKYCGEWFDLERSDKMYCNGNHRRLAFYHREKTKAKGGTE